ncbi:MAG: radical SAM protein [Chroococcidiopsidaceae cyanobacterium CP_BM_ER_R8_30]|nr:radical SAM protein [Chroococcidiopsidaceae cyanobacterium CP_BM_ER_R8_30]
MKPTGNASRILQIHPSRRCNLQCLHCYSSSSPEERDELSIALLLQALTDASEEGYTVASFSGGEPLLYQPLYELLERARSCGLVTTVTSNGMLLNERHLERLRHTVDLLAISLDGVPASHNRMRASAQAFDTMVARLEGVRKSGIPFGFIFTLTQYNLNELDWVANFALEQGAKLLQIHPLEEIGRGKQLLSGARPDKLESVYAYLEVSRLQAAVGNQLYIHLDLVNRENLRLNPSQVLADKPPVDKMRHLLADIVSPLIIEADGTIVPLEHGFARKYALGNLQEAALHDLAIRWCRERYQSFRDLCQQVFEDVTASGNPPFTNWYEAISHQAENG